MGVKTIWIVDPRRRKAFSADLDGLHPETERFTVPATNITVPVAGIFSEVNLLEAKATEPRNAHSSYSVRPGLDIRSRMASFGLLSWCRISAICSVMGISTP